MEQLIATMPDLRPDVSSGAQVHTLPLPPMCPVSGNPQPGSYVAVRYTPRGRTLEVYALEAHIARFVGGWLRDGAHIRDMEQMIATLAADCAASVGVPVRVRARLVLDAGRMALTREAAL